MAGHDNLSAAVDPAHDDSETDSFSERRSAPRALIIADLEIVPDQVCDRTLYVTDISQTGCRLFLKSHALRTGQYVALKFAHLGHVSGCVEWVTQTTVGVKFDAPLHVAVYDFIVREKGKRGDSGQTGGEPGA